MATFSRLCGGMLAAAGVLTLTGCLRSEVTHTIYVSPSGVVWSAMELYTLANCSRTRTATWGITNVQDGRDRIARASWRRASFCSPRCTASRAAETNAGTLRA